MGTSTKFLIASVLFLIFSISSNLYALPSKIRAVFNGNPSTNITLLFDTSNSDTDLSDKSPVLYYGTGYNAVNSFSSTSATPTATNTNSKMRNNIVRLENLNPGTKYYFKIRDNQGSSDVYYFETISNNPNDRLSIVAGGDSRSNRSIRVNANKLVAKFKPHVVVFDGDMTDTSSPLEWRWWFEDWQYTIDDDNRVTPIIPARGNHESNDNFLIDLFGCPPNVYYENTLGGDLLRIYTLNSEKAINAFGAQTTWLVDHLNNSSEVIYKFAQYHKPMRPHIKSKLEGVAQYAYWSNIFYSYDFDVVLEGDAHTSKITYPIVPCTGGYNCEEGFKRDDVNGTVYVGEGCWGAPIRANDDDKIWTRNSGMYNQFKLIFVDKTGIEIRTVLVDNESQVQEVNINDRFDLPSGQNVWTTGNVSYIQNKKSDNVPKANLISPPDNTTLYNTNSILLYSDAKDPNGNIQKVSFYVNGVMVNQDTTYPYQFNYNPSSYGQYLIHAIATDNEGLTSALDMSTISLVNASSTITNTSKVNSTTDDAEQYSNGHMDLFNWDLDLGYQSYTCGLRFQNINIPRNANITDVKIKFTADEVKSNSTNLEIFGHNISDSPTFFVTPNDISNRQKTSNSVTWVPSPWSSVGDNGPAQTTPNLKNVVQEMVNLPDWELQSAMTFIFQGSGYRVSETVDGDSIKAPVLTVSYSTSQASPIVNFIGQDTIDLDVNEVQMLTAVGVFPSGNMNNIKFKEGNSTLGSSSSNPAQVNAPTSTTGIKIIKVIATDNAGRTGEDELILNVGGACNSSSIQAWEISSLQNSAILHWDIVPRASYKIWYRKIGEAAWSSYCTVHPLVFLFGLERCKTYQWRVQVICEDDYESCDLASTSGFTTSTKTLTTTGCKTEIIEDELIESAENDNLLSLKAYPSPMQDNLNIDFTANKNVEASHIQLSDLNGKVLDYKLVEGEGKQQVKFDVSSLAKGTYMVSIRDGLQTETIKLTK